MAEFLDWDLVGPLWHRAFELAWEAHLAGSVPVGALVVDPAGQLIAEARSHNMETAPLDHQLANTRIAHAELNAVAQLPSGDYSKWTVISTLEPCLLCRAAIRQSHVGNVMFAASDALWHDLERLGTLTPQIARLWPTFRGPIPGPLGVWGSLLPLIWSMRRSRNGTVVRAYTIQNPELVDYAAALVDTNMVESWNPSLDVTLSEVWKRLHALSHRSACRDAS